MRPATVLTQRPDAVWLAVSVQPHARRTAADGLHDNTLRVRLAAPPVDGQANQALIDWLAAELHLPKRAITLARGASARRKWLAIDAPMANVAAWLRAKTSPTPSPPAR